MPQRRAFIPFAQDIDPNDGGRATLELVNRMLPSTSGYRFFPRMDVSIANQADHVAIPQTAEGSTSAFVALIPKTMGGTTRPTDDMDKWYVIAGEDAPQSPGAVYKLQATSWDDGGGTTYTHSTTATTPVGMWDFCQFGTRAIATCYTDPVKGIDLDASTPAWANLIDSTNTPKARFCAVIGPHLVLAKIDNSGGKPNGIFHDMFWWSSVDDPTDFGVPSKNGGGYYRLNRSPGVITGLVGGDYGIVFKANETWRIDIDAQPAAATVRRLSNTVGTIFPKSAVKVNDATYFWGADGIYVTDGRSVRPVPGLEKIREHVFGAFSKDDTGFHRMEDWPTSGGTYTSVTDAVDALGNLGQFVQGAYDQLSQCILWLYYSNDGGTGQRILAYHVPSGRFSFVEQPDTGSLTFNGLVQMPAVYGDLNLHTEWLARNVPTIGLLTWESNNVYLLPFASDDFETTPTMRLGAFRISEDRAVVVHAVRLVFETMKTKYGKAPVTTLPGWTVGIEYDHQAHFPNQTSQSVSSSNANSEGRLPFSGVNGEWFRFNIQFSTVDLTPTNIVGLEVWYTEEGDYG